MKIAKMQIAIMHSALLIWCFLLCSIFSFGQEKPNILFIVSEDNGPELGCYGAPVKTPYLDELANEGVLFENAYVPQAGCSPSRAAFLTGLYPHQNGQIGLATWKYHLYRADTPNIPKSLKVEGYNTGIIGKLHVNPESAFPFDFSSIEGANFARKNMDQYAIDAEKFMTESNGPFYLQVNYPDAHAPFIKQVDNLPKIPLTAKEVDAIPYMMVNNKKLKELTANYYNCLMRLDTYIGYLIEALKKSGKYQNTLIVYIGDHGADILRGKRTSYEGGVRIPMIISWPGKGLKQTRLKELTSTLDLYPTFLEAAGSRVPKYLSGKSLMPLLEGKKTVWRDYLFTEYHVHSNHNPYPQRTVRDIKYKLIYNPLSGVQNPGYEFTLKKTVGTSEPEVLKDAEPEVTKAYHLMKNPPEYELYDLEIDPYEMKNLSEEKEYALILERLKNELVNWQERTNDPLLDPLRARQFFDMVQKTGIGKPRQVVPYEKLLNPKMSFD